MNRRGFFATVAAALAAAKAPLLLAKAKVVGVAPDLSPFRTYVYSAIPDGGRYLRGVSLDVDTSGPPRPVSVEIDGVEVARGMVESGNRWFTFAEPVKIGSYQKVKVSC